VRVLLLAIFLVGCNEPLFKRNSMTVEEMVSGVERCESEGLDARAYIWNGTTRLIYCIPKGE